VVRVSKSVSCRRECAEGEGPPEGREGTRNRHRPGGHLWENAWSVGEVHNSMHACYYLKDIMLCADTHLFDLILFYFQPCDGSLHCHPWQVKLQGTDKSITAVTRSTSS
jgi:hypothetical protein